MGPNPGLPQPSGGDGLALCRWLEKSLLSPPSTASTGDFGSVILPPVLTATVLSEEEHRHRGGELQASAGLDDTVLRENLSSASSTSPQPKSLLPPHLCLQQAPTPASPEAARTGHGKGQDQGLTPQSPSPCICGMGCARSSKGDDNQQHFYRVRV